MPKASLFNATALTDAAKGKAAMKAFLRDKDNAAILVASPTARTAFIKTLQGAGKTTDEINRILGQVARISISTVDW